MKIQLNDNWRVVTCPDNHQWILQQRKGSQWHSSKFFRTRSTMLWESKKIAGSIDPLAWLELLSLPVHFKGPVEALGGVLERRDDSLGTPPPKKEKSGLERPLEEVCEND